jgi:putative transport protein
VDTLGTAGLAYLGLAAAIVLAAMAVGFVAGQFLLRTATDDLLGVISGITGNPAILVYANKAEPSDRIDAA